MLLHNVEESQLSRAEEIVALDRAFALAERLGQMMQRTLAERGLTTAKAEVLFLLHGGGPQVQRRVSDTLRCSPRHVTALVDALEEAGLVERGRHPTDRRATLVSLTPKGTAEAEGFVTARKAWAVALLGDTPTADLTSFIAVVDQFIAVVDRLAGAGPLLSPPDKHGSQAQDGAVPSSASRP